MLNLPLDIILVRHGESELNLAHKDPTLWTPEFKNRHTSNYKLTDLGRKQAQITGEWIKKNIAPSFDLYFCSNYVRYLFCSASLIMKELKRPQLF
jgi:NAD+ kinase